MMWFLEMKTYCLMWLGVLGCGDEFYSAILLLQHAETKYINSSGRFLNIHDLAIGLLAQRVD